MTFYVLLWKRKGISLAGFDDYWRDVHGPVCARLPGQFQYWQFHVAHNEGGIFPAGSGVSYSTADEDQFDGIAELTFRSLADRQTWFDAAGILMDDEHNIFSKAIGYVTEPGNSRDLCRWHCSRRPERRRRLHQVPCAGPAGAGRQQRRVPPLHDRQPRRPGGAERPTC